MIKRILAVVALLMSTFAFAQETTLNCNAISTFPTAVVLYGTTPKCVAGCPTVQPPLCADVDGIFSPVLPKNQKAIGDYTSVTCSDITTFPLVTKLDGKEYRKCVQKCQAVRPPHCVDYNSELR